MIKKIKLYFINRKINKLRDKIHNIQKQMNWVREHKFDIGVEEAIQSLTTLDGHMRILNMELNSYQEDFKRLSK